MMERSMNQQDIIKLIRDITAPIIADYVREVRELKQQLQHVQRQIVLLKNTERVRRTRELQAEATDDEY